MSSKFQYYNEEETTEIINKNNKSIYDELNNYYEIINKEETTRGFNDICISSDLKNIINNFYNNIRVLLFCSTNERNIDIMTFKNRFKICVGDKDKLDHYYYYSEIKILTHNNYYYMFCSNEIFVDLFIIHTSVISEDKLLFLAMDNTL